MRHRFATSAAPSGPRDFESARGLLLGDVSGFVEQLDDLLRKIAWRKRRPVDASDADEAARQQEIRRVVADLELVANTARVLNAAPQSDAHDLSGTRGRVKR